jgi:predicted transcriptional regulator
MEKFENKIEECRLKSLKFRPELAKMILDSTETTTWRMFDDKDLKEGDVVDFIN